MSQDDEAIFGICGMVKYNRPETQEKFNNSVPYEENQPFDCSACRTPPSKMSCQTNTKFYWHFRGVRRSTQGRQNNVCLLATVLLISALQLVACQWIPVHLPEKANDGDEDTHPVINKCCPLTKRYRDGHCVDADDGLRPSENLQVPYSMVYENLTDEDRPVIFR